MSSRRVVAVRILGAAVLALAVGAGGVAPASAAPEAAPAPPPGQRLASVAGLHGPRTAPTTGLRAELRVAGAEDTYLVVDPGCAKGRSKAHPNAVVGSASRLRLDYVLTGKGLRKTGTLKTKAHRESTLRLKAVRAGSYRLTLAVHGKAGLVADETFSVLPCLVVRTSCRAVTFTNPAGNPAAVVDYNGHKKHQSFSVDLAAGASRTVRADYAKIDFAAYGFDEVGNASTLGRGSVKVRQKCSHGPARPAQNAVQTWGLARCSTAGAPAALSLGWSVQPSVRQRRYEVLDAGGHVVLQGSFKGGKGVELELAAGSYTYRALANGLAEPFQQVAFDVLACVQVTPRCRAIEVQNPNAVPVVFAAFSTPDDEAEVPGDGEPATVPAHGTVTIPWTASKASVLALPQDGFAALDDPITSLASSWWFGDGDPETEGTTVPQNC